METNRIKKLVTLLSDAQSHLRKGSDDISEDIEFERARLRNLIERRELGAKGEASEEVTEGAALVAAGMRRAGHVLSDAAPDGTSLPCPACPGQGGCTYRYCPLCGA